MTTAPTPLDSGQRHDHRFALIGILALVLVGVTIAIPMPGVELLVEFEHSARLRRPGHG